MSNLDPVNFPIIAGAASGIRVRANPTTKLPFERLKRFALQGNHWARTCVQAVESLSSGQFKNFVYTQQPGKLPIYTMLLPGCKIECAKLSNSEFVIYSIKVDGSYFSLQEIYKKPALFNIERDGKKWKATISQAGAIKDEKYRVIAITDKQEKLDEAVKAAGRGICRFSDAKTQARRYGWDMHYTPGSGQIGGLTSILKRSEECDPIVRESAQLLAHSMTAAQKTEAVNWISVGGGSGVLTEAMRILKEQRVNFRGKEHYVLFSGPTTSVVKAQRLAMDIGMQFEGTSRNINYLNANELVSGISGGGAIMAEIHRFRSDPEHSILKVGKGIASDATGAMSAGGVLKVSAVAIGGAVGLTAVAPAVGFLGAVAVVSTCVSIGGNLTKAWLPRIFGEEL